MATKKINNAQELKELHARMQPEVALRLEEQGPAASIARRHTRQTQTR